MQKISYQLFSSVNFYDSEKTLKMLANAGIDQVEGFTMSLFRGDVKKNVDELKKNLDKNNLTMPILQILFNDFDRMDDLIYAVDTLEVKRVVVSIIFGEHLWWLKTKQDWHNFALSLIEKAKPLIDKGIGIGWHNHAYEFEKVEDSYPLEIIFNAVPDLKWEIDVAWAYKEKGIDPIAEIEKFADRIFAVHVKDTAPRGENLQESGWADLGKGIHDWKKILTVLQQKTNVQYYVLEHDKPSDDNRFANHSAKQLKKIFEEIQ